jgi:hypothetical protein
MRKLLLGFGLLAVSRYLGGRRRPGWRGMLSPQSLLGVALASAAGELLGRRTSRSGAPLQKA